MTRIEAGLVLIGVDFHSSRFAFNDEQCSTPIELGFGWMFHDLANSTALHRPRRGRTRARREASRWRMSRTDRRLAGLGPPLCNKAGLIPQKDETPIV